MTVQLVGARHVVFEMDLKHSRAKCRSIPRQMTHGQFIFEADYGLSTLQSHFIVGVVAEVGGLKATVEVILSEPPIPDFATRVRAALACYLSRSAVLTIALPIALQHDYSGALKLTFSSVAWPVRQILNHHPNLLLGEI